jgi:hypothetical protein
MKTNVYDICRHLLNPGMELLRKTRGRNLLHLKSCEHNRTVRTGRTLLAMSLLKHPFRLTTLDESKSSRYQELSDANDFSFNQENNEKVLLFLLNQLII